MSSARRKTASRANGKKSRGPVTPEGKARSAANTVARHGLASPDRVTHAVCLKNENPAEFILLHEALVTEFAPATTTEYLTVHEMAVCRWRLHRAWTMEDALQDNQMDHMTDEIAATYESTDEATRAALAFRKLAHDSPSLPLLHRYEARLSRQIDCCIARLDNLRAQQHRRRQEVELQAKPNPNNGHLHDPQLPEHPPTSAAQPPPDRREQPEPVIVTPEPTSPMDRIHLQTRPSGPDPSSGLPPSLPRAA
ncbi:MAG: hypothetical protein ACKV2U_17485 [Bryobacteraceae bacterium]